MNAATEKKLMAKTEKCMADGSKTLAYAHASSLFGLPNFRDRFLAISSCQRADGSLDINLEKYRDRIFNDLVSIARDVDNTTYGHLTERTRSILVILGVVGD